MGRPEKVPLPIIERTVGCGSAHFRNMTKCLDYMLSASLNCQESSII